MFRADITVTMGAPKPGLVLDPGRRYVGELVEVDLGLRSTSRPSQLSCWILGISLISGTTPGRIPISTPEVSLG